MKVSVITTVWNVEPYIEKTIRSIINQTLDDIELVLVNDCSPDNSIDILNKYADHPKVKIINNEVNLGPGVSRQIGLDNSIGEFTIFVDGDDYLELDCLEIMYNEAIAQNADIVSCKTYQHNDYGVVKNIPTDYVYTKIDFYNFINNKLIKRWIWSKTHYSPLRFREDINTLFRCLEFSNNTIKLNYIGYHYLFRPNSLTTTPNIAGKSYLYNALAAIENINFIKDNNIEVSPLFKRYYNNFNISSMYNIAKRILKDDINNYTEEVNVIETYINENKKDRKGFIFEFMNKFNKK